MRLDAYPVIGPLLVNQADVAPSSGFLRFNAPCGVHGLALVQDRDIHLLAVAAVTPGVGQFRNFVNQCKRHYAFIRLWAVMDANLRLTLDRYGFLQGHDVDRFGVMQEVWDWTTTDTSTHRKVLSESEFRTPSSP